MPNTAIEGAPAGPDGLGGAFRNTIESRRAMMWDALGGRQGVLRGMALSTVPGSLALSASAGAALVEERDASGNTGATGRGYHVWHDAAETVTFDAPSASARKDAVVVGFADTEDGALGTGVTSVGAQYVVVKGVSGTTTARTDSDINAWFGKGGWVRLADVLINPGDTEVGASNITSYLHRHATGFVSTYMASNETRLPNGEAVLNFATTVEQSGGVSIANTGSRYILIGGLWDVYALVSAEGGDATGNWGLKLVRNGATEEVVVWTLNSGSPRDTTATLVKRLRVSAGDYLEVKAHNNASTGTVTVLAGAQKSYLQLKWVGP